MRVLMENYLDQMTEELEIINFKLDRLFEAAITDPNMESVDDEFSLFESTDENIYLNEEAYEVYTEALSDSIRSIWNAVVRFIKSIFVSGGQTISSEEAKNIVDIIKSASADGKLEGKNMKNVVQKGFYLIAGLGTSVNGMELKKAYDSGDTLNYVMHNIDKINVAKIPEGSKFRVCVGSYAGGAKASMSIISKCFDVIIKDGVAGLEKLGKAVAGKAKSAGQAVGKEAKKVGKAAQKAGKAFVKGMESVDDLLEEGYLEEARKPSNKEKAAAEEAAAHEHDKEMEQASKRYNGAADAVEAGRNAQGAKTSAANEFNELRQNQLKHLKAAESYRKKHMVQTARTAAGVAVGVSMIALGCAALVKKSINENSGDDIISMATITYVNETKPEAMAKIRLYDSERVKSFDIKGHEKVVALRDELLKMAEDLQYNGDKIEPGLKENIGTFAQSILTFFSGLANKSTK